MITFRVRTIQIGQDLKLAIMFFGTMCYIIILSFDVSMKNFILFISSSSISINEFVSLYPSFYFKFLFSRCVRKNQFIMFSKRSKNLFILIFFITFQFAIAADCGDCQNCKTVNRKNECVQCMDGYRLDATGTSCLKVEQASVQERSSGRIATSIADLDSSFSSSSSSTKTVLGTNNIDPNCDIVDLNGLCRKCLDKFYLSPLTKKCEGISPLCKKWDQEGKCLSCVVGYSVNDDFKCVSAVFKKQNVKSQNKEIIVQSIFNPDSSGSGAEQSSSTSSQQTSTTIVESSSSSSGTSENSSDNFVVTIPQVKRIVSSITDVPSTKVETKKTIIGIPYNFQNFSGQFFTVDPYCARYQARVCKFCQPRYVLLGGICKKVSNFCSKWNELGKCTACYPGFDLKDQGQCVQTSTELLSQKFEGASVISDNNTVSNKTVANITTSTSSETTTTIKTVVEKPVQTKQIISSIQFVDPKPVPNCDKVGSDGLCTRCKFRYYIDKGACKEVSVLCKAWSLSTGACTQCYDGYSVQDATCVKNQSQLQYEEFMAKNKKKLESETTAVNIPNCVLAKKGVCETCAFKYYNLNGLCMAVSDLCNTWNDAGQCTSCKLGFMLSTTYKGVCVSKPITISPPFIDSGSNIRNVVTQNIQAQNQKIDNKIVSNNNVGCAVIAPNGSCSKCALRYVKNNDGCKKVSNLCSAWNLVTGGCTDCYPGSSLNGSDCVPAKNLKRLI